jgi:hypothetical protein
MWAAKRGIMLPSSTAYAELISKDASDVKADFSLFAISATFLVLGL